MDLGIPPLKIKNMDLGIPPLKNKGFTKRLEIPCVQFVDWPHPHRFLVLVT